METVATASVPTAVTINDEHRDSASRYIEAIARRDPLAFLGPEYLAVRTSELWDTFMATYQAVQQGPYAKHGRDAVRVALGRL